MPVRPRALWWAPGCPQREAVAGEAGSTSPSTNGAERLCVYFSAARVSSSGTCPLLSVGLRAC